MTLSLSLLAAAISFSQQNQEFVPMQSFVVVSAADEGPYDNFIPLRSDEVELLAKEKGFHLVKREDLYCLYTPKVWNQSGYGAYRRVMDEFAAIPDSMSAGLESFYPAVRELLTSAFEGSFFSGSDALSPQARMEISFAFSVDLKFEDGTKDSITALHAMMSKRTRPSDKPVQPYLPRTDDELENDPIEVGKPVHSLAFWVPRQSSRDATVMTKQVETAVSVLSGYQKEVEEKYREDRINWVKQVASSDWAALLSGEPVRLSDLPEEVRTRVVRQLGEKAESPDLVIQLERVSPVFMVETSPGKTLFLGMDILFP